LHGAEGAYRRSFFFVTYSTTAKDAVRKTLGGRFFV
jgi:hypothetical protein